MGSMGKTWVLDTETKGTGANMVPLEKVQKKPDSEAKAAPARRPRRARATGQDAPARRPKRSDRPVSKTTTDLPPGHVRKRSTGEIGKVEAVDSRAGTARIRWLKRGASSTVRLSEISRR
jgi:hypothetical protein